MRDAIDAGMPIRVLVVDDEEPIRFAIREYFAARGCDVDRAQEIEEAKALVNANQYDVILTDLHLTGIHGAEGLDLVSYVRVRGSTKIILLSAYGTAEIERAAFERGVNAFIHKPTPLSHIAQTIARLLGTE